MLCAVQKILSDAQNTTTFAWKKYMGAHDVVLVSTSLPYNLIEITVQPCALGQVDNACTVLWCCA